MVRAEERLSVKEEKCPCTSQTDVRVGGKKRRTGIISNTEVWCLRAVSHLSLSSLISVRWAANRYLFTTTYKQFLHNACKFVCVGGTSRWVRDWGGL